MSNQWLIFLFAAFLMLSFAIVGCGDDDDDDDSTGPVVDDDDSTDDDTFDDDITDDDDDDIVDDDDDTVDDDDDVTDDDDDVVDDDDDDTVDPVDPVLGCVEGSFTSFFGVLHSHTSYSDGVQTPADAFEFARDQAGLDILIVSDHMEMLWLPIPTVQKYVKCREQADEFYDPGTYLTGCGLEYSSSEEWDGQQLRTSGHYNIFYSPTLYQFPIFMLDFHNFYDVLPRCPECLAQFNHPGNTTNLNFGAFEYDQAPDAQLNLYEFNGGGDPWSNYFIALDNGWHVSPTNNQDNHHENWGTKNDYRSGLYLTDLDRDSMHDAIMARRTFSTEDKNATIKLMGDTTCWMGSILSGYSSIDLDVEASDPDVADGFTSIKIYGPDMSLITTIDCEGETTCSDAFTLNVTEATYVLARAEQDDGDVLISAPIWVEP